MVSTKINVKDKKTDRKIVPPPVDEKDKDIEVFRKSRGGRASGVTLPSGKTFLGLNKADVAKLIAGEQRRKAVPEGGVNVSDIRQQEALQQQQGELSQEHQGELSDIRRLMQGESFIDVFGRQPTEEEEEQISSGGFAEFRKSMLGQTLFGLEGVRGDIAPIAPAGAFPAIAGGVGGAIGKVTGAGGALSKVSGAAKFLGGAVLGGGVAAVVTSLTSGKVSEIEGDISELRTSTRDIVTDVTKGADSQEAIDTLLAMESTMVEAGGNLHLALQTDLKARLREKDIEEFMFRNLNAVVRRRQALERYQLDGNQQALIQFAGELSNDND